ncbi:cryptochrome/photolyase family protein [Natronosalvus vescus]|uniref:cryptochrome/photolyase family protein n=1 Tax=Natronosalvus vescus TaxID=2953881 RepID=UPI00209020EB|nr:deoxyribodipyrimidine photo-lyase [Natronosalvus vescus]
MHIHWHRRDLRWRDNRALATASDSEEPVVPVFVFDPTILEHASPVRVACLLEALEALAEWYREQGSDLVVARGESSGVIPDLVDQFEASTVTWNEDYSGLGRDRDRAVVAALEEDGIEYETVHDAICHEPGSITTNEGSHYSVFTYFWKKWRDREKAAPVDSPPASALADVSGDPLPTRSELEFEEPSASVPTVTPEAARDRATAFCLADGTIYRYADERDYPAAEATSQLSVDLKYGTIGIRALYALTERAWEDATSDADREGVDTFRQQLAWREFYAHVLAFNPSVVSENFSGYQNEIEWRNDPAELEAWKAGKTGYPIVDAGMRQLLAEGWVHNRVRMIVASFLTKDLLIDWRAGYDWYRRHLVDHDTSNDTGGWQWAASTGTDAQPYFRIFNPTTQGEKYDPDAEYITRYVPELQGVPPEEIHAWPDLADDRRRELAPEYPDPIVDHGERRERALEMFKIARGE